MRRDRIVIVGAGQAGARAAEALRQNGFDGAITLIGDEAELPYERPALSKSVLVGEAPPASAYLHPREYYRSNDIDLTLDAHVEEINPLRREVVLENGRSVGYTRLLLCTGSRARALPGLVKYLRGVHYLRTLKDCEALGTDLLPGRALVAIGGGFIGLELASSALKRGLAVTVVEQKASLLDRVVPGEIGSHVESMHVASGINVRANCAVVALHGTSCVEAVELTDGSLLPADVVAIGIGVVANTELAQAAGAACANGLLVDEYGKTSLPDIYAAGDVTNHPNPILGKRLRLESWQNAQNQAIAVAKNMLGIQTRYAEVPWFWSEQLGQNIQLLGVPAADAVVVWRGKRDSERCMAFAVEAGRVTSAIAFNSGNELRFARKLIESRVEIAFEVLRDTSSPLKDIVAKATGTHPNNQQSRGGENNERRSIAN